MKNEPQVPCGESSQKETVKVCRLQAEEVGEPGNEGLRIIRVIEEPQIGQRGNDYQCTKDQWNEKSLHALLDILDSAPFPQREIGGSTCQNEEQAHMPVTQCPDKDVGDRRAQLIVLDVIVSPGMENTGGVEKEKEKYGYQA